MIKINLLPTKAAKKKESFIQQLVIGAIALGAFLVALYLMNNQMQSKISAQRLENNRLQEEINQLASVIAQVEDYKKKKQDRNSKIDVIKKLNDGRSGPVKMLEEFTYTIPDKLWLETWKEKSRKVEMQGTAATGAIIADFLDNLKNSKYFSDVELLQTTLFEKDSEKMQQFRINMSVNYTPE
jgi:type IV pilus assembly protein PilN